MKNQTIAECYSQLRVSHCVFAVADSSRDRSAIADEGGLCGGQAFLKVQPGMCRNGRII